MCRDDPISKSASRGCFDIELYDMNVVYSKKCKFKKIEEILGEYMYLFLSDYIFF